jgi:hypothetical protein
MVRADAKRKAKLIKATGRLHQIVTQAFNQEPNAARTPFYERERYAAALMGVANYFTSLEGRPLGQRFFELGSAKADLNSGIVHPLLRPERADNRRADNSQLWRARAHVALGLEALLRSGLTRDDAAAKLTRGSPAIAKLASAKAKNSKLKTIVFGWRQQLRQARVKNFEASELFSEGLRRIEAMTNQPNALRQFSMQQLREATKVYEVLSPSLNTN